MLLLCRVDPLPPRHRRPSPEHVPNRHRLAVEPIEQPPHVRMVADGEDRTTFEPAVVLASASYCSSPKAWPLPSTFQYGGSRKNSVPGRS